MTSTSIAAFFDLDRTVLDGSSSTLWARYLYREGRMSLGEVAHLIWWTLQYKLAVVDMAAIVRRLSMDMKGQSEADLIAESDRWYQEMVAPRLAPKAVERIEEHKAQGHTVAILTASTVYVGRPVARALGLDDNAICTRLEVADGRFTGRCIEPICYGPGKVYWARIFAQERGLDLSQAYFYSDSFTDLAMLEAVAHPVAVNPDTRLRRLAGRRGWPVERFH
jgi:HAD superfamily hydrolase (TIGR01490 family)